MSDMSVSTEHCKPLHLASEIVAAYVSNNKMQSGQIPQLLREVYAAVTALADYGERNYGSLEPAVPVDKSITPDYVICLEDGKKLKMLKRYLRTHYNLSPEEYRRKWNLPADYPMVAPNYAKRRSQFAKDIGLGTAATKKTKRKTAKRKRAATKRK